MDLPDQTRLTRQKAQRTQRLRRCVTGEIVAVLVLLTALSISVGRHASPHSGAFVTVLTLLAAIAVVVIPVIVYGPSSTD